MNFSNGEGLLYFTFRRGQRTDGQRVDRRTVKRRPCGSKNGYCLPGVQARRATVADIMNGTEQELDMEENGADTVLKGMRTRPVLGAPRAAHDRHFRLDGSAVLALNSTVSP